MYICIYLRVCMCCECVCVCVCLFVCLCVRVRVFVCVCVRERVCVCVRVCVHACLCVRERDRVFVFMCLCVSLTSSERTCPSLAARCTAPDPSLSISPTLAPACSSCVITAKLPFCEAFNNVAVPFPIATLDYVYWMITNVYLSNSRIFRITSGEGDRI